MDYEATLLKDEHALGAVGLQLSWACELPGDLVKMQFLIQWF